VPANDLALFANFLDAWFNFHFGLVIGVR
jgi:hypothetical protein